MQSIRNEIMLKVHEVRLSMQNKPEFNDSIEEDDEEENRLSFLFLETELERRQLTKLSQLPLKGTATVIEFVNNLPANLQLFKVLQNVGLTEHLKFPISEASIAKIKLAVFQPKFYCPFLTGTGYYCPQDQFTHRVAALELGSPIHPTIIGFSLPDQLNCHRIGQIFNICKIFQNSNEFLQKRHEELKLPSGIIGSGSNNGSSNRFHFEPKPGHNISHKKQYADIAFTFVREYRQFSLSLGQSTKPQLGFDFINRVQEICTYQLEDYFGEKQWQHFFTFYGTHQVVSACGGGKLVITISETHLKHYFKTDNLLKKQAEIEQLFSNYLDLNENDYIKNSAESNSKYQIQNPFETLIINSIVLHGGDSTYEGMDLVKCTKNRLELQNILQDWIKSLQYYPVMLDSNIVLEPIPDILERYGLASEAFLIDKAAKQLFGKSLRMGKQNSVSSTGTVNDNLNLNGSRRYSNLSLPTYSFA